MNSIAPAEGGPRRFHQRVQRGLQVAGWLALTVLLASCQTTPVHTTIYRQEFHPDNVFVYPPRLALEFRRVAVLPIAPATDKNDLPAGCEALETVLFEQVLKTKKFEAVAVDARRLKTVTGQPAWTGREVLPTDFFTWLKREYDCDGVLFAELTTYRAYAPLAVGWRFKLVDLRTRQVIWSADELFDAARPDVQRAANHFETDKPEVPFLNAQNWAVLNSPRRFGRYSAAALLDTLPKR